MTSTTFVDFYEILSLPETADAERITDAIRGQRRLWNKRAAQSDPVKKTLAEQRIRDLATAESTLLNSGKRTEYDRTRASKRAKAAAEGAPSSHGDDARRDWIALAREYFANGNAHAANYSAREAIAVNGADHEAWSIRANSSFMLANYADAGFEFREAIRLLPHNPGYHFDYGEAHAAVGTWADALVEYETALRLDPANPVYKTAIASAYLQTNRASDALRLMDEVVADHPDVEVFQYYLAAALHDANLDKWSRRQNGAFTITSPEQIAITREMSGRALKLKFSDEPLRRSLQENLDLANKAEAKRWDHSSNVAWYLGGILMGLLLIAAYGLGIIVTAAVVWAYVTRHYLPGWKINAADPYLSSRGI